MKDILGHGSNSRGSAIVARNGSSARGIMPTRPYRQGGNEGGGQPMSSNAQAAQALASTLKATQAPVHDSMATEEGRAYNRDLSLRIRDRQVGSGMRHR